MFEVLLADGTRLQSATVVVTTPVRYLNIDTKMLRWTRDKLTFEFSTNSTAGDHLSTLLQDKAGNDQELRVMRLQDIAAEMRLGEDEEEDTDEEPLDEDEGEDTDEEPCNEDLSLPAHDNPSGEVAINPSPNNP